MDLTSSPSGRQAGEGTQSRPVDLTMDSDEEMDKSERKLGKGKEEEKEKEKERVRTTAPTREGCSYEDEEDVEPHGQI